MRFANSNTLQTLSERLDYLFKNNLLPFAGKNKAKSVEEEVSFPLFFFFYLESHSFIH